MGLDMSVYKVKSTKDETQELDDEFLVNNGQELFYWRKHPDMHGMMEKIYREKTGNDDEFNCVDVYLDSKDLDRIEESVERGNLPHTEGFFFGQSSPDRKEDDLEFIKKAREALKEGYTIYYTSWW